MQSGGPPPVGSGAPLPAPRTLKQLLMTPLENLFSLFAGSRPVPDSRDTFLVACHPHRGPAIDLPDGTRVRRGDRVAEIHFWNRRIAAREGESSAAVTWRFIRDFRADLGALARALAAGGFGDAVQAVYGASPLAPGAARFGFTVRPLPKGLRRTLLSAWQRGIRRIFRPGALRTDLDTEAAELWMSTGEFLERYGQTTGTARRAGRTAPAAQSPAADD